MKNLTLKEMALTNDEIKEIIQQTLKELEDLYGLRVVVSYNNSNRMCYSKYRSNDIQKHYLVFGIPMLFRLCKQGFNDGYKTVAKYFKTQYGKKMIQAMVCHEYAHSVVHSTLGHHDHRTSAWLHQYILMREMIVGDSKAKLDNELVDELINVYKEN